MKTILLFLIFLSAGYAMPSKLEKEVTRTTRADGSAITHITFKNGNEMVLRVVTITPLSPDSPAQRIETYYYHGIQVYMISRLSAESVVTDVTSPAKETEGFLIQIEDANHDGFPESILITSKNFDSFGFNRNSDGDMIPIAPVIFTNGKPTFYNQK